MFLDVIKLLLLCALLSVAVSSCDRINERNATHAPKKP